MKYYIADLGFYIFSQINESDPVNDKLLYTIKKERGYSYEDEITCSKECLPNYESKVCTQFKSKLHLCT